MHMGHLRCHIGDLENNIRDSLAEMGIWGAKMGTQGTIMGGWGTREAYCRGLIELYWRLGKPYEGLRDPYR